MRTDEKFILDQVNKFLADPIEQRNIEQGAMLLLKLNRNQTLYRNIMIRPEKNKDKLFYELSKFAGVEIVESNENLPTTVDPKEIVNPTENNAGKRADHEQLPDEIKLCYNCQTDLYNEIRSLHERMKLLLEEEQADDRKAIVNELTKLKTRSRSLWEYYDQYKVGDSIPDELELKKEVNNPIENSELSPSDNGDSTSNSNTLSVQEKKKEPKKKSPKKKKDS